MNTNSDVRIAKPVCLNYKSLLFVLFVLAFSVLSTSEGKLEVSESELIALESSDDLLPTKTLTERIERHLAEIRKKFPQVAEVKHQAKWQPGELIVSNIDKARINSINASQYGPVETNTIFSTDTLNIYTFKFSRPYNPIKLAAILQNEFAVKEVEPNGSVGNSMEITYTPVSATSYAYTFKKGWGDCPSGCIHKHFWNFSVQEENGNLRATLDKEYGDDLQ